MHELGFVYNLQDKHIQAEKIYLEVIPSKEKVFGKEHAHTLLSKANLGVTYVKQE